MSWNLRKRYPNAAYFLWLLSLKDALFFALHTHACLRGMLPPPTPSEAGKFCILEAESSKLVNTFRCKLNKGDENKISVLQAQPTQLCTIWMKFIGGQGWYTWACAGFVTAGCWRKIVSVQVERSERSERSVLTAWGPGARSRALVGSRGNAPAGVQGAEPPEAPGFSGFFRPQNASPRIVFLLFWRQVFLQNHLIYYDIRWYNDEGSFIIFRYRLLYYHTEAWFWFWHWCAQGECLRVMCPPWKAWFFFLTGIVQFAEYFRVQK